MSAYDVAIVGFGFAGLSVLAHVVREAPDARVAVLADDHTGHGLAYATRDTDHLLNVIAGRMGLWASDPGDFGRWLSSGGAAAAARSLGISVPDEGSFAPRALYGAYLDQTRRAVLASAAERVQLVAGRARSLRRRDGRWHIGGDAELEARSCVLATGHDRRPVFGAVRHPCLYDGPWALPAVVGGDGSVVLIGSGLTAVDAVLSLRRRGYDGAVLALSRNGRLPAGHTVRAPDFDLSEAEADGLDSVSAIAGFIRRGHPDGQWRPALDALRPHTARLWQQLAPGQQRAAVRRWSALWNVHRHRMAPRVAERIARELQDGRLAVRAVSRLDASITGGELTLQVVERGTSGVRRIHPAMVIDCTGPQLRCAESSQPLLRNLIASGVAAPHPTGLGVVADDDYRIGRDLYALGPLLVGQRWESIAVPELREGAEVIARAIADTVGEPARSRGPAVSRPA